MAGKPQRNYQLETLAFHMFCKIADGVLTRNHVKAGLFDGRVSCSKTGHMPSNRHRLLSLGVRCLLDRKPSEP